MSEPTGDDLPAEIESLLLGSAPTLTRIEVAERAGVPVEMAHELWRLLGFPQAEDTDVAFTESDVKALRLSHELMTLGILSPDSQAALVRTWARSFARLAEWETGLLAGIALQGKSPEESLLALTEEVLPRVEQLQTYIWRRHLASATTQLLATEDAGDAGVQLAICFVDIVGYTSRSKDLDEADLVTWIEHFENEVIGTVVDHGGRVIKTIGDEVLFVHDDPRQAAEIALVLTARGEDEDDSFPSVRAGVAYGTVVRRLGDVFGPTVNIAARLTSLARPGAVIADHGLHDLLCRDHGNPETRADDLVFRRLRRTSVKGYSRLESWVVRTASR
jgi:adenylate cyclase